MLGEKRGYWGKWMLGESRVQKRNRGWWGKSVGEMQMLGGKEVLGEQDAGERELQRRMGGVRRKWDRWGKGREGGSGLLGVQDTGGGPAYRGGVCGHPPCGAGSALEGAP